MKRLLLLMLTTVFAYAVNADVIEGDFTITMTAGEYVIGDDGNMITFQDGAEAELSGSQNHIRLEIPQDATVKLKLNNYVSTRVEGWGADSDCSIYLNSGSNLYLELADGTENTLEAGNEKSAIRVVEGSRLTISGNGTLNATVKNGGAAAGSAVIGAQYAQNNGDIYILGGTYNFDAQGQITLGCTAIGTGQFKGEGEDNGLIVIANATINGWGGDIGGVYESQYSNVIIENSTINNTGIMANTLTINGEQGEVSGNFTLKADYTVPDGILGITVPEGAGFNVNEDVAFNAGGTEIHNYGTIVNSGTFDVRGIYTYGSFKMPKGYFSTRFFVGEDTEFSGGYIRFIDLIDFKVTDWGYYVDLETYKVVELSAEEHYGDEDYVEGYDFAIYTIGNTDDYSVEDVVTVYGRDYEYVVTPAGREISYSSEKPENYGIHTMTATFVEFIDGANKMWYQEKTVDFTVAIAKAIPSVETPSGLTARKGQTLADVALPTVEGGTWAWVDNLSTSVGEVGTNTFKALFSPDDLDNYETVETDVDIEVSASTDVQETPAVRIHALNGRIYCDGLDVFTIIDLAGQDVTAMNGSLHGIYVVIAGDMAKKVSVR